MRVDRSAGLIGLVLLAACASEPAPRKGGAPGAAAPAPAVCADFSFPVYFSSGAALDPQARAVLAEAAARVRGCRIEKVEVLGLADATGRAGPNMTVSRQRADAVAAALAAAGLPRPAFSVEAAGQIGATTPLGAPEPLRRRAEVVIRAAPPRP
jgi:outer membrane protein OmpA-like peptidoglycan-associated protein